MGGGVSLQLPLRLSGDGLPGGIKSSFFTAELLVAVGRRAVLHRLSECVPDLGQDWGSPVIAKPDDLRPRDRDRRFLPTFDHPNGAFSNDRLILTVHPRLGIGTWRTGGCLLYTSPSPRDRQKSRM